MEGKTLQENPRIHIKVEGQPSRGEQPPHHRGSTPAYQAGYDSDVRNREQSISAFYPGLAPNMSGCDTHPATGKSDTYHWGLDQTTQYHGKGWPRLKRSLHP